MEEAAAAVEVEVVEVVEVFEEEEVSFAFKKKRCGRSDSTSISKPRL